MRHSSDIFSFYENNKILCGNMMTIDPASHLQEKYFRICDCMEQVWNISFLNEIFGYRINPYDLSPFEDRYWDILTKHYNIMNTISTLKSVNLNWANQPEDLSCYLTEEKIRAK